MNPKGAHCEGLLVSPFIKADLPGLYLYQDNLLSENTAMPFSTIHGGRQSRALRMLQRGIIAHSPINPFLIRIAFSSTNILSNKEKDIYFNRKLLRI